MMDRREFLASLAALGSAALVTFRASEATELQLEQAWARAQGEPCCFEVGERTIFAPGDRDEWPSTRREVYCVSDDCLRSPADLDSEVAGCAPLANHFSQLAARRKEEIEEMLEDTDIALSASERRRLQKLLKVLRDDEDEGWRFWVHSEGPKGVPEFATLIGEWLDEPPDSEEYEWFPVDFGPQGRALAFFRDLTHGQLRQLGVVIVEGEHPGSTYFAAELRSEPEEANEAAVRLGVPIRFRRA